MLDSSSIFWWTWNLPTASPARSHRSAANELVLEGARRCKPQQLLPSDEQSPDRPALWQTSSTRSHSMISALREGKLSNSFGLQHDMLPLLFGLIRGWYVALHTNRASSMESPQHSKRHWRNPRRPQRFSVVMSRDRKCRACSCEIRNSWEAFPDKTARLTSHEKSGKTWLSESGEAIGVFQ